MTTTITAIVASTRPGRRGPAIADWVSTSLADRDDVEVRILDVAAFDLPLLDEPNHPSDRNYTKQHTKRWSAAIDEAEALLIITPEHNRGMPASLKNALDYLYWEWQHKPVGFVSYSGGAAGGTRAVEMTKQVVTTLGMLPVPEMVNLARIESLWHGGELAAPEGAVDALHALADSLVRYNSASMRLRCCAAAA